MRLAPAVCPVATDLVSEVRQASLACLECFVKMLKEEEETRRSREAAAAEGAGAMGGAGGSSSSSGAASYFVGQAPAMLGATSSMLTWAVSGLMNTVGGATPAVPGTAPPPVGPATAGTGAAAASLSAAPAGAKPVVASEGRGGAATSSLSPAATGDKATSGGDGWEDDDEAFEVQSSLRMSVQQSVCPELVVAFISELATALQWRHVRLCHNSRFSSFLFPSETTLNPGARAAGRMPPDFINPRRMGRSWRPGHASPPSSAPALRTPAAAAPPHAPSPASIASRTASTEGRFTMPDSDEALGQSGGGGDGWGSNLDEELWENMEGVKSASALKVKLPAPVAASVVAAAAVTRPVSAAAARTAATGTAVGAAAMRRTAAATGTASWSTGSEGSAKPKLGAMKLGANKVISGTSSGLGSAKGSLADLDNTDNW